MTSRLVEILAQKRIDVAARKAARPRVGEGPARPAHIFRAALSRSPGARFILEAKRASPSQGSLRPALDAVTVAAAYVGVADAISVVTDGPFFGGSLEFLGELRAAVPEPTPLLCKDFVVDPYQIAEARSYGADAVLLMLSVLDDETARTCLAEAERLGMDALVEVHDEAELARALALPAPIVGINNRDFRDLSVSLTVTERLAPRVPRDRILVSESGVATHADVMRLGPQVDGFLVGSALMKSLDLRVAARQLVTGAVKICGLTTEEDAAAAASLGATYGGLIFAESPRRVSLERARVLAASTALPLVGVFRDAQVRDMAEAASTLGLAAVQLHGSESPAQVRELRAALPAAVEIFRAIAVDVDGEGPALGDEPSATRLLFDARTAQGSGGTGRSFAWARIAAHPRLPTAFVAGGIGPENAAAARAVGAYGVDVGSGVESAPGKKSRAKLEALFGALRAPSRRNGRENSR